MSSFEPRRTSTPAAPFLPLSGLPLEGIDEPRLSSVFAELVERTQIPVVEPAPEEPRGKPFEAQGDDLCLDDTPAPGPDVEAEQDAEKLRALEAALHAAYERGLRDARNALDDEYGEVAKGFADAIAELGKTREEARTRHHRALVHVAFKAARKIVGEELDLSPARWLAMIRDGVHRTLDRETIVVRVGGTLHRYLAKHLEELRGQLEEVRELELVEDPGLPQSGCVIETAYGDLDLSPESQLDALEEAAKDRP